MIGVVCQCLMPQRYSEDEDGRQRASGSNRNSWERLFGVLSRHTAGQEDLGPLTIVFGVPEGHRLILLYKCKIDMIRYQHECSTVFV